ncbi:MAG: glycosyltransferase, partial [Magnetococcales bacterium]|nr:glycosyltransferase [Magnetococcales bacterium]
MAKLSQVRYVLFFTQGMSLLGWKRGGLLEREVALYRALRPHLRGVTFVTYGDRRDLPLAAELDGIEVVCNRWGLSPGLYRWRLGWLPGSWKRGQVVFKSNQLRGSDLPLELARRLKKPFIARCGYLPADQAKWSEGVESEVARRAMALERRVFAGADRGIVTTPHMQAILAEDYGIGGDKVRVIPNYVMTDLFRPPVPEGRPPGRLIFVGRLERQKNLHALIEA